MPASSLDEAYQAGCEAWPGLTLERAAFDAYVTERLPDGGELERLAVTDLYLAAAAAGGDPRALAAFDRVLADEVRAAGDAAKADATTRDEAAQVVRTLLFVPRAERPPAILDYAGRGPLRGWLRVTATREILRVLKRGSREVELEDRMLEAPTLGDDPALASLKARYREALAAAFRDALAQLGARERTLLRYQLIDALSIDDIGAIYQVHRATAARWLGKVRDELVDRTYALLAERLGLDASEVPSVVRLVQSQLEVSVISHLR